MRNPVQVAVHDRPLVVPGAEDRFHRHEQLFHRVLREGTAGLVDHQLLIVRHHRCKRFVGQFLVKLDTLEFFAFRQQFLEVVLGNLKHHIAEHLDKTTIGVEGEPAVRRGGGHTFDSDVIQAQVENRVHHSGHRENRAGTNGEQQRVRGVAEDLTGLLLDIRQSRFNLFLQSIRETIADFIILAANFRGDCNARRHRQADAGHFRQTGALAAQQRTHIGATFFKQIHHFSLFFRFVHALFPPV